MGFLHSVRMKTVSFGCALRKFLPSGVHALPFRSPFIRPETDWSVRQSDSGVHVSSSLLKLLSYFSSRLLVYTKDRFVGIVGARGWWCPKDVVFVEIDTSHHGPTPPPTRPPENRPSSTEVRWTRRRTEGAQKGSGNHHRS